MDIQSQYTIEFLQSIAQAHATFAEFARLLRARPQVKFAEIIRFSPTSYISYFGGELGVTTTLKNGGAVDWWIELQWNENIWTLEYNVERSFPDRDGTQTAIAFPKIQTTELNVLIEELNQATAQLIATLNDEITNCAPSV